MFRRLLVAIACLLPCAAFAQTVVPLEVGGAIVKVDMPAGYQRLSVVAPDVFAAEQKAVADESVLFEDFVSDADAAAARAGRPRRDTFYQVTAPRAMLDTPITDRYVPAICELFRKTLTDENRGGVLPDVPGATFSMYGRDPDTVRTVFVIPGPPSADKASTSDSGMVVAVLGMLSDRMVQLQAVRMCSGAACGRSEALRAQADAFYGKARMLNPRDYERAGRPPAGTQ